jgi:hypothetical protein
MSSRLFKFGYVKPDREKEDKERMKRVEKANKEIVEKSKLAKDKNEYIETWRLGKIVEKKEDLEQKKEVTHYKNIADAIWEAWTLGDNERTEILKDSEIKLNTDIKNKYQGIYKDIKNKFPDIDIDFYIICLSRNSTLHNIIDLQTINYNKYIAYKLLELINDYEGKTGLRISFNENSENINLANIFSEISKSYRPLNNMQNNMINNLRFTLDQQQLIERQQQRQRQAQVRQSELLIKIPIDAILDRFNNSKAFIKELDSKIFMNNVNIQWTILQNAIKNNLFKALPKSSPKPSPMPLPKPLPKPSPKISPKVSSKTSPKVSPKASPKTSPKSSLAKSSLAKSSSSKTSPKSSSPKASHINRDEMTGLTMEELFAKLAKSK